MPGFQQNCIYKKGEGPNWAHGLSFADPCFRELHEINGKKKIQGHLAGSVSEAYDS